MSILNDGESSWPNSKDTYIEEIDDPKTAKTRVRASLINGIYKWITNAQNDLGGTLKGSYSDLQTRLVAILGIFDGAPIEFTAEDATPSVKTGSLFIVPAAVTITDFDDKPSTGTKLIEIIAGADNVVIKHDITKIRLNGGIDVVLNKDDSILFRYDGKMWIERYRSLL